MGQAMVDLPDPLETPAASGLGADDLLAQMAGEEIDRLLAEAEAETPKVRTPRPPVIEDESLPLAEPQGPAPATVDAPAVEATAAVASSAPVDSLAGELDSLLDSLTTAQPPAPILTPAPADAEAQPSESEQIADPTGPIDAAISAGESAALFSTPAEGVWLRGWSPSRHLKKRPPPSVCAGDGCISSGFLRSGCRVLRNRDGG